MSLPPLLQLADEAAYRQYFEQHYVHGPPVYTYDGIEVRFFANQFRHAFYRPSSRGANDRSAFARERAQRMDWIRPVLADPSTEVRRRTMPDGQTRRVTLEPTARYVVVTQVYSQNPHKEVFITAFWISSPLSSTLAQIRSNPAW